MTNLLPKCHDKIKDQSPAEFHSATGASKHAAQDKLERLEKQNQLLANSLQEFEAKLGPAKQHGKILPFAGRAELLQSFAKIWSPLYQIAELLGDLHIGEACGHEFGEFVGGQWLAALDAEYHLVCTPMLQLYIEYLYGALQKQKEKGAPSKPPQHRFKLKIPLKVVEYIIIRHTLKIEPNLHCHFMSFQQERSFPPHS